MSVRDGQAGRQNYLETGEDGKFLCSFQEQFHSCTRVLSKSLIKSDHFDTENFIS